MHNDKNQLIISKIHDEIKECSDDLDHLLNYSKLSNKQKKFIIKVIVKLLNTTNKLKNIIQNKNQLEPIKQQLTAFYEAINKLNKINETEEMLKQNDQKK